jgi:hypothetical protein
MNNKITQLIDSRYLKIIAAKKDQLKNAIIVVCLDEDKYGCYDLSVLRKFGEDIQSIEETSDVYLGVKGHDIRIYDKNDFKNKDILVTISARSEDADLNIIEESIRNALPHTKSIEFLFCSEGTVEMETWHPRYDIGPAETE